MASILIVDDNAVVQRVISVTLRKAGHALMTASHATEAIQRLAEGHVDLMLLDVSMPDVDGLTLLRQLRADTRYRELPIVMLTASGQDQDRLDARAAGANDFLTKPASSAELVETVRRWLPSPHTGLPEAP
jgi:CheY-like chemotaxis protein